MSDLLQDTKERAARYLAGLPTRRVAPTDEAVEALERLEGPLPETGAAPSEVLATLDDLGSPATVATAGGRYFGFVIGSALPAALGANWLAGTWNQNAAVRVMSPTATRLESVAVRWIRDLLDLPGSARGAFVSGDTVANFSALAAARHALLRHVGWDVAKDGLFGAPKITVVVGDEVHVSVLKALALLGLGRDRVVRVPCDGQGRMRADAVPTIRGPTILCVQSGNVNSGAFDPIEQIGPAARAAGAWVHVDGAFGLWARASPKLAPLAAGAEHADSWALDGHKWLNVPYDSGIVFVRESESLREGMGSPSAAYLPAGAEGEPMEFVPEMSRRARGVEAWAALRSLGSNGMAELVERCCAHATRFAERLRSEGFEVLNDVVLNQVLVAFGDDERTRRVVAAIQRDGTCWCGSTVWHGRTAMRISVSSWATTAEDVDRSLAAMVR